MRLRDYHDAALKNSAVCFDCRRPVTSDQKLHHYDHSSGWKGHWVWHAPVALLRVHGVQLPDVVRQARVQASDTVGLLAGEEVIQQCRE